MFVCLFCLSIDKVSWSEGCCVISFKELTFFLLISPNLFHVGVRLYSVKLKYLNPGDILIHMIVWLMSNALLINFLTFPFIKR